MLQYSPLIMRAQNWGMVQRQHSGLWIHLFWFESGCPSLISCANVSCAEKNGSYS